MRDPKLYHGTASTVTALWNLYDARAGEFTEASEYDYDEYDTDGSATVHPLEANLSRYLHPG